MKITKIIIALIVITYCVNSYPKYEPKFPWVRSFLKQEHFCSFSTVEDPLCFCLYTQEYRKYPFFLFMDYEDQIFPAYYNLIKQIDPEALNIRLWEYYFHRSLFIDTITPNKLNYTNKAPHIPKIVHIVYRDIKHPNIYVSKNLETTLKSLGEKTTVYVWYDPRTDIGYGEFEIFLHATIGKVIFKELDELKIPPNLKTVAVLTKYFVLQQYGGIYIGSNRARIIRNIDNLLDKYDSILFYDFRKFILKDLMFFSKNSTVLSSAIEFYSNLITIEHDNEYMKELNLTINAKEIETAILWELSKNDKDRAVFSLHTRGEFFELQEDATPYFLHIKE